MEHCHKWYEHKYSEWKEKLPKLICSVHLQDEGALADLERDGMTISVFK